MMKTLKLLIYSVGLLLVISPAYAFGFKFDLLGYTIEYEPSPTMQIINEVDTMQETTIEQIHDFDEYINLANDQKQVQLILKELDYERIGFIDTDTSKEYTVFISVEGIILGVWEGLINPEITLSGSLIQIKYKAINQDFFGIAKSINIPFQVKLKLLIYKILRWN